MWPGGGQGPLLAARPFWSGEDRAGFLRYRATSDRLHEIQEGRREQSRKVSKTGRSKCFAMFKQSRFLRLDLAGPGLIWRGGTNRSQAVHRGAQSIASVLPSRGTPVTCKGPEVNFRGFRFSNGDDNLVLIGVHYLDVCHTEFSIANA